MSGYLRAPSGRESGAQASLCFDRHIRAVLRLQFPHNISYMNFDRAFAHVQVVSYYLIRLAFLDRSNDREFTACEVVRSRWLGQHDAWRISRKQAIHRRIGPPRKNKAHRRDGDLKPHGYWNITFCAMKNGALSQFGVIVVAEDNYRYSRRELR
jgi:hypothetical protein